MQRDERGELKYTKDNVPYLSVKGYYSYNDLLVVYDADENGYRQYTVTLPTDSASPAAKSTDIPFNGEIDNRIPPAVIGSLVGGGIG